jgi:hypothetical protein
VKNRIPLMWHLKRRFLIALTLCLLVVFVTSGYVFAAETDTLKEARFRLLAGYRTDDLDWNIAGDTNGGIIDTRLNEMNWESKSLSVNLDLAF